MALNYEFMFQVSTKAQYALGILQILAENPKTHLSVKALAERKRYSAGYLQEILVPLKKAKIIISKEGSGGGYRLARSAHSISLLEVMETIDGPLVPVQCIDPAIHCPRAKSCGSRTVWQEATAQMRDFFSRKTIADIAAPEVQQITDAECKI